MGSGFYKVFYGASSVLTIPEAQKEWEQAAQIALEQGRQDLVEKFQPNFETARVKKIDTQLCKLLISLGFSKEEAEQAGYGCMYQWEKAERALRKKEESMKAFGLWGEYPEMKNKINRLLKLHNIRLKVTSNRKKWGDQVEISIQETGLTAPMLLELLHRLDALLDFSQPVTCDDELLHFKDPTKINQLFEELSAIL